MLTSPEKGDAPYWNLRKKINKTNGQKFHGDFEFAANESPHEVFLSPPPQLGAVLLLLLLCELVPFEFFFFNSHTFFQVMFLILGTTDILAWLIP